VFVTKQDYKKAKQIADEYEENIKLSYSQTIIYFAF
jgi:hypothetical protein